MKRRSHSTKSKRDSTPSPYVKYNKVPYNYQKLYSANKHLRHHRFNNITTGSYAPHVSNPHFVDLSAKRNRHYTARNYNIEADKELPPAASYNV